MIAFLSNAQPSRGQIRGRKVNECKRLITPIDQAVIRIGTLGSVRLYVIQLEDREILGVGTDIVGGHRSFFCACTDVRLHRADYVT